MKRRVTGEEREEEKGMRRKKTRMKRGKGREQRRRER